MKKSLGLALLLIFLSTYALASEFYASKSSNLYHYPDCKVAQKIRPKRLIIFGSPEAAIRIGYVPCNICKPPRPLNTGIKRNQITETTPSPE